MAEKENIDPVDPPVSLEEILEAILIDVAEAQDASNKYSAEVLAPEYKEDTLLKEFPVPNSLINELEIELKFKVDDAGLPKDVRLLNDQVKKEPQYTTKVLSPYVKAVVEKIKEVLSSFFNAAANITEKGITKKLNTLQSNLLSDGFTKFLNKKILSALLNNEKVLLKENKFDAKQATQKIMLVIEQDIYNQEQLDFVFGKEKSTRKKLDGMLKNPIYTILSKVDVPMEVSGLKNQNPDLRVYVTSPRLEEISSDLLSAMKIKVEVRNYKWATDPNNPDYSILLPTTS